MARKKIVLADKKVEDTLLPNISGRDNLMGGDPEHVMNIHDKINLLMMESNGSNIGVIRTNQFLVKEIDWDRLKIDLKTRTRVQIGDLQHIAIMKLMKHGVKNLMYINQFNIYDAVGGKLPIVFARNGKQEHELTWSKDDNGETTVAEIGLSFRFEDISPMVMTCGKIDFDNEDPELWKNELLNRFQLSIEQIGLEIYG